MERRSFLLGLGAVLAAPAIVRAESLMKVAKLRQTAADKSLQFQQYLLDASTYGSGFLMIHSDGTIRSISPDEFFNR